MGRRITLNIRQRQPNFQGSTNVDGDDDVALFEEIKAVLIRHHVHPALLYQDRPDLRGEVGVFLGVEFATVIADL
jgi:hypothetical protein